MNGKRYAVSGIGQSLALLTFAGLGLILEKVTPVSSDVSDLLAQFLASVILFPAATRGLHVAVLRGTGDLFSLPAVIGVCGSTYISGGGRRRNI